MEHRANRWLNRAPRTAAEKEAYLDGLLDAGATRAELDEAKKVIFGEGR